MDPLFWELHSGLDHEAPGSAADTRRALALAGTEGPARVLDIASGPGAASLVLLDALPEAQVTATDRHAPFLEAAAARVAAAGHAARFRTVAADMAALPFAPASFDLLWCEGAAYIIGVPAALAAWRPLLAPGGRLAFSEAVWLTDAPAPRAAALFAGYPAMTDVAGVRAWIAAAGLAAPRRLPPPRGGLGQLLRPARHPAGGARSANTARPRPSTRPARRSRSGRRTAATTATPSSWRRRDRRRRRRAGRARRSRPVALGDDRAAGGPARADGALRLQPRDRPRALGSLGADARAKSGCAGGWTRSPRSTSGAPPRRHEVVEPLAATIAAGDLPRRLFEEMIAARLADAEAAPLRRPRPRSSSTSTTPPGT